MKIVIAKLMFTIIIMIVNILSSINVICVQKRRPLSQAPEVRTAFNKIHQVPSIFQYARPAIISSVSISTAYVFPSTSISAISPNDENWLSS